MLLRSLANILRSLTKPLRSPEKHCVRSQNPLSSLRVNAKFIGTFCDQTQSFSWERKGFASECNVSRGNAKVSDK